MTDAQEQSGAPREPMNLLHNPPVGFAKIFTAIVGGYAILSPMEESPHHAVQAAGVVLGFAGATALIHAEIAERKAKQA